MRTSPRRRTRPTRWRSTSRSSSWELEFFTKHFIEGYRGVALTPGVRDALVGEWRNLAGLLAAEPRVLCHRDYHSRNLMLSAGDLYVIDFQDARMGPDTYDLASLLRDSYVDLPEDDSHALIDHFVALKREGCPDTATTEWERAFRGRFEMMALQRNLKALGTFGYQTTARSNPVYMQYIPRTLRYVSMALERQPQFGTPARAARRRRRRDRVGIGRALRPRPTPSASLSTGSTRRRRPIPHFRACRLYWDVRAGAAEAV